MWLTKYSHVQINKITICQEFEKIGIGLMILTLPLNSLPARYTIPGIGNSCYIWFLLLTLLLLGVEKIFLKGKIVFPYKKYWLFFCIWTFISIIVGSFIIPIDSHLFPLASMKGYDRIILAFPILADSDIFMRFYLFIIFSTRAIKDYILPLMGIFIVLYHLYNHNFSMCIRFVICPVVILVCIMEVYSIPEVIWLYTGNELCAQILSTINIYLFDPGKVHGWWPPILWEGQLRSLCAEPSFFGIIAPFLLPFLWYVVFELKCKWMLVILVYFSGMFFLTQARTAIVIYFIECVLFGFLIFLFNIREKLKIILTILGITAFSFFTINIFPIGAFHNNTSEVVVTQTMEVYVEKNITSVAGITSRSNSSRYGNIMAAIQTGLDYPVFGVGRGYDSYYIRTRFPSLVDNNPEVNNWKKTFDEKGIFKGDIPRLNQYAYSFAWGGILGEILFILPIPYVFLLLWKKRKQIHSLAVVCVIVTVVGQLISLMSNMFFLTYPIAVTLLYVALTDRKINI